MYKLVFSLPVVFVYRPPDSENVEKSAQSYL